jgi:uncharacterized protein YndB with AHSA1/START domain
MGDGGGRGGAVEVSVEVAAKPETVWRCLAEGDLLTRWLSARATIDPRPGGALRIDFSAHRTVVVGVVEEARAPEALAFSWGVEAGDLGDRMPPGSTRVRIRLEAIPSGTRVVLRHEGLPDEEQRRDHGEGWTEYLAALRALAARA